MTDESELTKADRIDRVKLKISLHINVVILFGVRKDTIVTTKLVRSLAMVSPSIGMLA